MATELKDGTVVEDRRLDRLYEEDWNSLNYPVTLKLEQVRPVEQLQLQDRRWDIQAWLDQGNEGACVGFGFSQEAIAEPKPVKAVAGKPINNLFARQLVYWEAQRLDQWQGGSYPGASPVYEGTSVLAGAKVMQRLGLYKNYYWALDLKQMALSVSHVGPVVIGVNWYEGMFDTDADGFIRVRGRVMGGHCTLVLGVKVELLDTQKPATWENVDQQKSYFKIHNSWGQNWGSNGECNITFADMQRLMNEHGDFCIPDRA